MIEAFLRVAQLHWGNGSSWQGIPEMAEKMLALVDPMAKEVSDHFQGCRRELFCERCDVVMRNEVSILRTVYEHYRPRYHDKPKEHNMVLASWLDLLQDADAYDDQFRPREGSLMFGSSL